MQFTHQDSGATKDVLKGLTEKRAELGHTDGRGKHLADASLGAIQKVLSGQADDSQATVTAVVEERTEHGKLVLSKLYVDVTLLPAPAAPAVTEQPAADAK